MIRITLLLLSLSLAGCTHAISKQSLNMVDRTVTYPMLRQNPETYKGKYVLLGGSIAKVRNAPEESELEVVQLPIDRSGMPEQTYRSKGRFLATADKFLDPLLFKEGRNVTVVGEVRGTVVRPLDQVQYRYPLIAVREIHLWRPEDYERRNYYPPAGYPGYWYDPWWPSWYYRPGPFMPWW